MKEELRVFLKYVSANVSGMLGLSCYILADTFFIAKGMGSDGLAALNLAIVMYSLISAFGQMIGVGSAIRYAIARAKNNQEEMNRSFTQGLLVNVSISLVFAILGQLFSAQLSYMLGANEATFGMTNIYLRVIFAFTPAFMLNNLFNAFVRNDGNPSLAMAAMLVGSGLNIVLDYVFIFIFDWGMFGAAFATGFAPISGILVLSLHSIRKKHQFHLCRCSLDVRTMFHTAGLGTSVFINEISSGVILFLFNWIILQLEGNIGVAAYGVVANIALVAVAIFSGVAQGSQPIISEAYGKSDIEKTHSIYRYAVLTSLIAAVVLYVFIYIFAAPITQLFNGEENVRLQELAENGLRIYFTGFIFAGINIITAAYFSAVEQVKESFIVSILRGFILIAVLVFMFSKIFGMIGVWITFPGTELAAFLAAWYLLQKSKSKVKHENSIL